MSELEEEQHHVKFNEEHDSFVKENCITIHKVSDVKVQAHLGFLKINHTYEIILPLEGSTHVCNIDWIANQSSIGTYSTIKNCEYVGNCINLHIVLKAAKPKLMTESLKLYNSADSGVQLEVELLARVLGKDQGTPMLKDGIHCIGVEVDEESEASDWQGFN